MRSVACDPRRWPALLASASTVGGAQAFELVSEAERAFPGLVAGLGCPVLDPLLERPGFADEWRRCGDRSLRDALAFRIALLGGIPTAEIDPATADEVARDLVARSSWIGPGAELVATFESAARVYPDGVFREALVAALRACPSDHLSTELVRCAMPLEADLHVELGLRAIDPFEIFGAIDDARLRAALVRWADAALAEPAPCASFDIARRRLDAFVLLARAGSATAAHAALVDRRVLSFTSDFPEEPSPVVLDALAAMPADARSALIAGTSPLPWKYAASADDPRVIEAAVGALEAARDGMELDWAIRSFHAWGARGRAALDAAASPNAARIREALDVYASRRPVDAAQPLEGLPRELSDAIRAALDDLDADPAGWPPRRAQFRVLAALHGPDDAAGVGVASGSWRTVETYLSLGSTPSVVAELRRIPRHARRAPAPPGRDERFVRLLLELARLVLPVWEQSYPEDRRVLGVIEDAESVLAGAPATAVDVREALREEAYAEGADWVAYGAARVAVCAHSEALDDGTDDEQDTPGDLAEWPFMSRMTGAGPSPSARRREFWRRFFLELVPRAALAGR